MTESQADAARSAAEYFFAAEGCWISEWWNTPDDPAASIARARVEPGAGTRWHRLAGTSERYVILAGRRRVEVGTAPPRDVAAGDVVLIPAATAQRIRNTGDDDLVFLAICTPRFRADAYTSVDEPAR
ncbi:MAG TPA: cupin domain-containing protein [Rhodanobacteraceae bacterium]|nr:cupin domain-containing protein [Rhodanobacteraceae bacterium]